MFAHSAILVFGALWVKLSDLGTRKIIFLSQSRQQKPKELIFDLHLCFTYIQKACFHGMALRYMYIHVHVFI